LTTVKAGVDAAAYSPRQASARTPPVRPQPAEENVMSTAPVSLPDSSADLSRLAAIQAARRELDPDAQVALDPDGGKMKVLTVLPPEEVVQLMRGLGERVELTADDAGAEPGSCGCGCSGKRS
jgi:hypothetical protein